MNPSPLIGLLAPAVLWSVIPASLFLIYLYLRQGRGKRVVVSSLLLLGRLKRNIRSRRKFIPPLRFFFELLLLLLLLAGAAGVYLHSSPDRLIVVLDNSFGMRASDSGGFYQGTLLEQGKQIALEKIREADQIAVHTTSPAMKQLTQGFVSREQARQVIESVEVSFSSGSAARSSLPSGSNSRILLITNKKPAPAPPITGGISLASVGNPSSRRQNVALTRIALRQTPEGLELLTAISAFTTEPVSVTLTVSGTDGPDPLSPISKKILRLNPGEVTEVSVPALPRSAKAFRAALLAPEDFNSITEDDRGWIVSSASGDSFVLVADLPPKALGLAEIPWLNFEWVKPEDYPVYRGGASAYVFHRFSPPELPDRSALFILPASGPFFGTREVTNVQVSRWESDHPIATYLNLPVLSLPSARPLAAPGWAKEIISSTAGPLCFAGEKEGHRYVALGFELLPYEGRRSPLLSILTLNAVRFLSGAGLRSGYQDVYTAVQLKGGENLSVLDGGSLAPKDAVIQSPGLYLAGEVPSGRLIAADYLDAGESNTLDPGIITLPAAAPGVLGAAADPLYRQLALLVLALLLLDVGMTLVWRRRAA